MPRMTVSSTEGGEVFGRVVVAAPQGVDVDAWLDLVDGHAQLEPARPSTMMNPFTKQPVEVHEPVTNAAMYDGARVLGGLRVCPDQPRMLEAFGEEATMKPIAVEVARALGGELVPVGPAHVASALASARKVLVGVDQIAWAEHVRGMVADSATEREVAHQGLWCKAESGAATTEPARAALPFLLALLAHDVPQRFELAALVLRIVLEADLDERLEEQVGSMLGELAAFLRVPGADGAVIDVLARFGETETVRAELELALRHGWLEMDAHEQAEALLEAWSSDSE
jgi:hypothetical protein